MAVPIWKDYYFTIPVPAAEYRLKLNNISGDIIYTGRATARPNASSCLVKVNDICADYVRQTVPDWSVPFTSQDFVKTFVLEYLSGASWVSAGTIEFYADWSFDYHFLATRDGYSFPVRDVLDARQYLPVSVDLHEENIYFTLKFKNGTTSTVTVALLSSVGTAVLDLTDYSDLISVTIEGRTFKVDSSLCHNYALYYVNAHGGWDTILLSGKVQEQDNYERFMQMVEYDNRAISGRGTLAYVNEITKTYSLQTGWIDDAGASRMHHLLGSTQVLLHDLSTGDIMPVVLTNAGCPYKTYRNERKLINYTIEATLAQDRHRK